MVEPVLAGRGIDGHSADGIAHLRVTAGMMVAMAVAGVIVTSAAPRLRGRFGRSHGRAATGRALRHGGFRLALVEIGLRIGGEFGPAAGRAEMIGFAAMVEPVLAGRGIDRHSADGVAHASRRRRQDGRHGRGGSDRDLRRNSPPLPSPWTERPSPSTRSSSRNPLKYRQDWFFLRWSSRSPPARLQPIPGRGI